MDETRKGFIQLHLSVLLAGFTGLFGRLITLNEVDIVWYRMLFTSLILLVFTGLPKVGWRKFLQLCGCGALLGVHWILFYGSIKASNVSIGVICFSLIGFFTALFEPIIYKRRLSWLELLFSLITVLGLSIIFSFDARYRYGIAIGVVSSAVCALYAICNKKVSVGVRSRTVLMYQMSGGLVLVSAIIPVYLFFFPSEQPVIVVPDGTNLWLMLCHALFCTVAMYLLQIQALKRLSAFTVNLSYNLEPCYTIILAFIIFGEGREINYSFYIGIALILLSVLLQTRRAFTRSDKQKQGRFFRRNERTVPPRSTLGGFLLMSVAAFGQVNDLPRTSPEAVGIRSAQVTAFFDSLLAYPQTEIHSAVVMRHGKVVGEMYPAPFRAEYKHTQFSCSKTFVAAAVGIAIGEKKLQLKDRLVSFFPEQLPKVVSWRLAGITVEDLLTMRSGFVVDKEMRNISQHWVHAYLNHPMNADPGKLFQYDSIDTYLLSAIVQKATGMTVLEYLKQKVFNQLNIKDVFWEHSPEGIVTGGWGLYIQTESLAKFGQLLLQRGQWHSEQLIPAAWVDAMMTKQVEFQKGGGYGYQMWTCDYPTAMRADGAYGQYIVIVPKEDVVVVINQCTMNDGAKERSYIWDTLFKEMQSKPLPPSEDYQHLLHRTYSLPLLEGELTNRLMADYLGRPIQLQKNALGWSSLRFNAYDTLEITDTIGVSGQVVMGHQTWNTSSVPFHPLNARYQVKNQFSTIHPPFRVGACYAWQEDELRTKLHFVDWMGSVLMKFSFSGDTVRIVAKENYRPKAIAITGLLEPTPEKHQEESSGKKH